MLNSKAVYKVVLVDNHPIIIEGLKSLFSKTPTFQVLGSAGNENELNDLLVNVKPDLLLLALKLPRTNISRLIRNTTKLYPDIKIIVFSNYITPILIENMVKEGVSAYLSKSVSLKELKETIIRVHEGERFISSSVYESGFVNSSNNLKIDYRLNETLKNHSKLTERELDIIVLLSRGSTNKDMASELCLSKYTIETHRKNILKKLNLKTSAQLVYYASQSGLI